MPVVLKQCHLRPDRPGRLDRPYRLYRRVRAALIPAVLVLVPAAPLLALAGLLPVAPGHAWQALVSQPGWWPALRLSLWTGVAASLLAWWGAAWVLAHSFPGPRWPRLLRLLAPALAVPHAALAIGIAFLLAPSGWLLRLLSPWATGWTLPPPWPTTQDPWGLGLIAVLVCKELPFLLWVAAAELQRADGGPRLTRELRAARSLGLPAAQAWRRVVWPQLAPRLHGPALAVLAYSLTVVDMALVIGPGSPPTLAVLAWQWLLDHDPQMQAAGIAAAWLLAGCVLLLALLLALAAWGQGVVRRHAGPGRAGAGAGRALPRTGRWVHAPATAPWTGAALDPLAGGLVLVYAAALAGLALASVAGVWPFPQAWPRAWSLLAWGSVAGSLDTLFTTLGLGLLAGGSALVWAVAWLELAPPAWERALGRLIVLPLLLPTVLWVLGAHQLCLVFGADGTWSGLWLAHAWAAMPYVLLALRPAYGAIDPRHARMAASLGQGPWARRWRVKWPMLRAPLAAALAVGFAVSVSQYLPTLFIGGGRYVTVTTEAVTHAAGAQRAVAAAYAWLQGLLPVLAFALAAWAGRPRRFAAVASPGAGAAA